MSGYAAYAQRLARLSPLDYSDPNTVALLGAVGDLLDELEVRATSAVISGSILNAPEDSLLALGGERGLTHFPGEPLETYRTRVLGAFEFWQLAGTLPGLELALNQAGYRATIVEHFRDPDPLHWAEFSIAVSPLNPLPNNAHWGDGTTRWGDGHRWGVDPNAVPTDYLPDLVRQVKPAHARLRTLAYFPRGRFWGGQLTWGEGHIMLAAPPGWGLNYGLPDYPDAGTDSGPRWGVEQGTVLYQLTR